MKADTKKTEPNPEMGSIMRSAWKKPQWCRSEDWGSSIGTRIWPRGTARSWREGSRQVMNRRRDWFSPAGRCPAVQEWHGAREASSDRTALGPRLSKQPRE
jgi:hypothetical protein